MAANIQPYKRQLTPSGQGRIPHRRLPEYTTYHWRSLSTLGRAISGVAGQYAEKRAREEQEAIDKLYKAERDSQVNDLDMAFDRELFSHQLYMNQNPQDAANLPGTETPKWLDVWNKGATARRTALFKGITNPDALMLAERHYDSAEQSSQHKIMANALRQAGQNQEEGHKIRMAYWRAKEPQTQKELDEYIASGQKEIVFANEHAIGGMEVPGAAQNAINEYTKSMVETYEEEKIQRAINLDPQSAAALIDQAENIKEGRKNQLRSQVRSAILRSQAEGLEQLEILREKNRDDISKAIREGQIATGLIEQSALDEKEQWTWFDRERAEVARRAKGEDIITDPKVKTELQKDIMGVLTGAMTRDEVLAKMAAARFDPKNPTLHENDYAKLETSVHAQYEQAYIRGMSQVNSFAEGLLLNPDSLGYIKNAPIRYKTLGEFNDAWQIWIAEQGDKLKVSDIYPEGRYMASLHQISDEEAERQEIEMNRMLEAREKGKEPEFTGPPLGQFDQTAMKGEERAVAFEKYRFESLPRPKNKAEFDALKSGERFVDPEGVERIKP